MLLVKIINASLIYSESMKILSDFVVVKLKCNWFGFLPHAKIFIFTVYLAVNSVVQ